jgi:23S rRNA (uracil1939-C5)-methyltransferase
MGKKIVIIPSVSITGIADRGKGIGRTTEGLVVFAEGAVPGDVVDVFVQKKKDGFVEGNVESYLEYSQDRVPAFCRHFTVCGGCKWQNLNYAAQLRHKQQVVEDALTRIAKIKPSEIRPIIGASQTTYYRNKLEFGFSNRRWLTKQEMQEGVVADHALGFHRAGFFDKIIDIEHCWLQPDPSNELRNTARDIAIKQGLEFYDLRRHTGFLRNLMVRITTTGETMILVSFAYEHIEKINNFLAALANHFGDRLTTIVYCINKKLNDTVHDLEMITWRGKGHVEEKLGDLRYKIGPKSFFQTNSRQGKALYDVVVDFVALTGQENVYDLYTGTGSIALYVARYCKQVTGIEEISEAIEDAKENMYLNDIHNAFFYAGDVKEVLSPEFAARHGRPDVVITDPPRAGMHEKATRFLLDLAAPRIVYVSCNPATQARDLQILSEKYDTVLSQAVDMFPHTHHIENVVLLQKR